MFTTNPELKEEWDFEKNKTISPTSIGAGYQKKAWWICKNCGNELPDGLDICFICDHVIKEAENDKKTEIIEDKIEKKEYIKYYIILLILAMTQLKI